MLIKDLVMKPSLKGDVGVEIECEGKRLPNAMDGAWKAVEDHSLRNGMEYVYKTPLTFDKVEASIDHLNVRLADSVLDFSFRTSVHVHVNCLEMDYKHVLNYIFLYLLVEDLMVAYCGDNREGNRFCLRMRDAEGIIEEVKKLYQYRNNPPQLEEIIRRDHLRYASINIEALIKYGSLEFRAMRGTTDKAILLPWISTLLHIREYAKRFNDPMEIATLLEDLGADVFAREIIGEYYHLFHSHNAGESVLTNYSLSSDLIYTKVDDAKREDYIVVEGSRFKVTELRAVFGELLPAVILRELERQGLEAPPARKAIKPLRFILDPYDPQPEPEFDDHEDDEEEDDDE